MVVLRLTQKLATRIRVPLPKSSPAPSDPLADFSCISFTARRIPYILIANTKTMLSVVCPARGCANREGLVTTILLATRQYWIRIGHGALAEKLLPLTPFEITIAAVGNRSVTSTLNEYVFQARYCLEDGLDETQAADQVNEMPTRILAYDRAFAAMAKAIGAPPPPIRDLEPTPIDHLNAWYPETMARLLAMAILLQKTSPTLRGRSPHEIAEDMIRSTIMESMSNGLLKSIDTMTDREAAAALAKELDRKLNAQN